MLHNKAGSFAMILTTAAAFIFFSDSTDKSTAQVNQLQGLYIFTDSRPVAEYEYLGTITYNGTFAGSVQYQPVRDKLIKRLKEKYPNADGVVFSFINGSADKADAIRFK